MKYVVRVTVILPKNQLTARERAAAPVHMRHGRKRLRSTVEAEGELDAVEAAKKVVMRKYPTGYIELVELFKSD